MWRNNAVTYVNVPYNKVLFSIFFLTRQSDFDFGIAHVCSGYIRWERVPFYIKTSDYLKDISKMATDRPIQVE